MSLVGIVLVLVDCLSGGGGGGDGCEVVAEEGVGGRGLVGGDGCEVGLEGDGGGVGSGKGVWIEEVGESVDTVGESVGRSLVGDGE